VGKAHRTKVAQHIILKKKCLTRTRRRIPKDLVYKIDLILPTK
jgi:hypothetical protein